MSFFQPSRPYVAPVSPSLASVLSSRHPSSGEQISLQEEWVVFSPQFTTTHSYDYIDTPSVLHLNSRTATPSVNTQNQNLPADQTGLELPRHNGSGLFSLNTAEIQDRRDLFQRVNMWRLEQSDLVFHELQSLERKFFAYYQDECDEQASNEKLPESQKSVWGSLKSQVMANLESFLLPDEVLDFIFAGLLPEDPEPQGQGEAEHQHQQQHQPHSERARGINMERQEPPWDKAMLSKVFSSLSRTELRELRILDLIPFFRVSKNLKSRPEDLLSDEDDFMHMGFGAPGSVMSFPSVSSLTASLDGGSTFVY